MAKLRIVDSKDSTLALQPDGYINVVTNLFGDEKNYDRFANAAPTERPEILQGFVGTTKAGVPLEIQQLRVDGTSERITNANCTIISQPDRLSDGKTPSVVTVPLPVYPYDVDLSYVDRYAAQVVSLYQTDKAACYKFLFGTMMLTRCR